MKKVFAVLLSIAVLMGAFSTAAFAQARRNLQKQLQWIGRDPVSTIRMVRTATLISI